MKPALAIFAKTPALSPVKTRLAADIGSDRAAAFYELSVRIVEELALSCSDNISAYWAIAEEHGLADPLWQNLDRIWTGHGSFGQRLHHVYDTLLARHGAVILIGTDSPQLTASDIRHTVSVMNDISCIIGPARDGGFYLFGGGMPLPAKLWLETPYSVPETLFSLRKKLTPLLQCRDLGLLSDVDTVGDLSILQSEWKEPLTRSQADLRRWIDALQI